jgi:serine/threonine protein kinase
MSDSQVQCKSCNEGISSEDSFCPYCGNPNCEVERPAEIAVEEQEEVPENPSVGDVVAGATAVLGAERKAASKLKPLETGTGLANRYEILKRIGGGGMGAVYLASDRNLGGAVRAVKEMVQSYIEGEKQEKAIEDFKRESLLLSTLDHVSIPTIYDYFFDEVEHRFYLVMKYIPGGDLATRLRTSPEGRLEEGVVLDWAIQLTEVLEYLHNHTPPIVYRDLKPANVMVDGNTGRAMLIDFGIARWVQGEQTGVTAVGTMGYAPPELFSGNVDPRSDIYSLGATLFHVLTGADPQANPLLIFDFDKNPRPRQINTVLSAEMDSIIVKAVQYNSSHRFQSVAQMGQALRDLKERAVTDRREPVTPRPARRSSEDGTVFCGFCGRKIFTSDHFCPFCGARQRALVADSKSPSGKVGFGGVSMVVLGVSGEESVRFEIEKPENLIGRRDPSANIFPEIDLTRFDPKFKISRRHAKLIAGDDGFKILDNGSANGTFLLREDQPPRRLEPGQAEALLTGDDIRLGDVVIRFVG